MNEQLVVKNFGPIKDATVDFKRVTVFIGPTGGGKSTLAKLAMMFKGGMVYVEDAKWNSDIFYEKHRMTTFATPTSVVRWQRPNGGSSVIVGDGKEHSNPIRIMTTDRSAPGEPEQGFSIDDLVASVTNARESFLISNFPNADQNQLNSIKADFAVSVKKSLIESLVSLTRKSQVVYFPAERVFIPSIEYSWAGLLRDDIGLPKDVLDFANSFSTSRKEVLELDIPFLNAKYIHHNGQDFIKIPEREEPLMLLETASGIQSVTPLLVLLEHLSRNTEQAQSFIIEEPELNLFPIAQFELVKTLVEKCARLDGQNDLVLTTHSPYVLTALNLMCYAFRIAQQDEATAKKVAKLIPRNCWIDPDQFAAYYVDRPDTKRKEQVRSIINKKTGLIEENELDTASDELGDVFDKLVRLRKPTSTPARARK